MATPRLILLGMLIAQLADALTFVLAVTRFGIEIESNGLAVALYRVGGLDAVLVAKLVAISTAVGTLALTARRFPRLLFWGGATATSFGLMGFVTNSAAVLFLG